MKKGVQTEEEDGDATIWFDVQASIPAIVRVAEERAKDLRRVELKKFSLQPEDFGGWINQIEEYAV